MSFWIWLLWNGFINLYYKIRDEVNLNYILYILSDIYVNDIMYIFGKVKLLSFFVNLCVCYVILYTYIYFYMYVYVFMFVLYIYYNCFF